MAKKSGVVIVKSLIQDDLRQRLDELRGGSTISGALTITKGHDYWWFLEYGTATLIDQKRVLGEGLLRRPPSVLRHPGPGGKSAPYPIKPNARLRALRAKSQGGQALGRAKYWLFFFFRKSIESRSPLEHGWNFAKVVYHQGIAPRAPVRKSLWEFRKNFRLRLMNLARRRTPPSRKVIVDALNVELLRLTGAVRARTPESVPDPPPPPGKIAPTPRRPPQDHLADAWGVSLAK